MRNLSWFDIFLIAALAAFILIQTYGCLAPARVKPRVLVIEDGTEYLMPSGKAERLMSRGWKGWI